MARYREASAQEVRDWARSEGYEVGDRGRFSTEIVSEFNQAHKGDNLRYGGGSVAAAGGQSRQASGNARSQSSGTRTQSRASNSGQSTRRPPSGATRQQAAPARQERPQQKARVGDVQAAVMTPSGTGLSDEQMAQFSRMLADANAVTGQPMELTIVRLSPAPVA